MATMTVTSKKMTVRLIPATLLLLLLLAAAANTAEGVRLQEKGKKRKKVSGKY